MSLPTIGIVKVPTTEAYRANPSVINDALAILSKAPGTLGQWHDLGLQNPEYIYFVNAWESIAHRDAFAQDKETYTRVHQAINPAFDPTGPSWRYHVQFAVEPFKALDALVTELTVMQLKDGADSEQFKGMLRTLQDVLAERLGGDVSARAWGVSFEDPRVFVACLGWMSLEASKAAAEQEKGIITCINQILQLADVEAKHATLTRYSGD
ncbi:uncharacterized protein PHACADRAFT_127906 [Phanerochaete carnosa HHB-10118-sp]|uniref:ABM domain-containing protein n=1 Tax=Phanerochaete carnosa (strain HHB-10118-sp) TaxID=650164 RepID=K5UQ10_PHACS|nr:uncharacterized protein PHACADRAFT_127906 [Phanerochaete carnosa HHB-10118-sp]EKM51901.1 hypothetical protein PHACADRAFT_127906 [Phanerochaete carnosa HHB-10118-sp]